MSLNQQQPSWVLVLCLFFLTSVVESLGMSHVFAFLPVYLQSLHVSHAITWIGILTSLPFLIGFPLVPLWGVWAARYGGKAVIIRSAYVEMLVFALLAWAHSFGLVVAAMALVGFQLGNTGIMLSAIRSSAPTERLGFAVSFFSVSSTVGNAVGPLLGGWFLNRQLITIHGLFYVDAALSFITGTLLWVLYREGGFAKQKAVNESAWNTAWKSMRVTFTLKITWILFGLYTVLMIGRQMANPYLPVAIERMLTTGENAAGMIGLLMGLTALVGAVMTVYAGRLGDRFGFNTLLLWAFVVGGPTVLLLGIIHSLIGFSLLLTLYSASVSIAGAMIMSLLSTQVPDSHRTTALNLVYLPLYVGGVIGPAISSWLSQAGVIGPFAGACFVFVFGIGLFWRSRSKTGIESKHGLYT